MLRQQLIPQDLARLATPSHSINVEVGEALLRLLGFIAIGEHLFIILENRF
jgi:hypothetical protein